MPKLKRELGLFEATLCGIGIILGAGIYALIGKAAGLAGNAVWISFLLAAAVAAFTGLSYAELSSIFPKAGAEYVYTKKAFGKKLAFMIGWLILIGGTISGVVVALGFAGYFGAIFQTPIIPVAILLILGLSFLIFYGIKQSARVAVAFTLVEAAGLFLIIIIGLPHLGSVNYLEPASAGTFGIFTAAALIFFAFIGFEEIVRLSEETKKPEKVIPKALIIAIVISSIIYILVAISAVSILGWEKLGTSNAPLADVASAILGPNAFLILAVIALFSTTNTVLLIMLANSRIMYGMAKERSLPKSLSKIHNKRKTPWLAIAIIGIISMVFTFAGSIEKMAILADFAIFITFIAINLALICLRYTMPNTKRPFRSPINIGKLPILAILGVMFSAFMLLNVGIDIMIAGTILTILGVLAYEIIEKHERDKTRKSKN